MISTGFQLESWVAFAQDSGGPVGGRPRGLYIASTQAMELLGITRISKNFNRFENYPEFSSDTNMIVSVDAGPVEVKCKIIFIHSIKNN